MIPKPGIALGTLEGRRRKQYVLGDNVIVFEGRYEKKVMPDEVG